MTVYSIEIDSESEGSAPKNLYGLENQLCDELHSDINNTTRSQGEDYLNIQPIQEIIMQTVTNKEEQNSHPNIPSNRYKKVKPIWVKAEIWKRHIQRGEHTSASETLSEVIRRRGACSGRDSDKDDCGHVVAASLGGKMVDVNLFPQNQHLNRGWSKNYCIWRAVELCIKLWVTGIPEKYKPRVKFQMLLRYKDPNYPDRPNEFKYVIKFLMDDDDEDDEEEEKISISNNLFNIAMVSLQCVSKEVYTLKKSIKELIKNMSTKCKMLVQNAVDEFLKEWCEFIPETVPEPPRVSRFYLFYGGFRQRLSRMPVDVTFVKIAAKTVEALFKTGAKESATFAGKSVAKKIPVLGMGVGCALALARASGNDYVGAVGELASGAISMVPGTGTTASLMIDAWLFKRDLSD